MEFHLKFMQSSNNIGIDCSREGIKKFVSGHESGQKDDIKKCISIQINNLYFFLSGHVPGGD